MVRTLSVVAILTLALQPGQAQSQSQQSATTRPTLAENAAAENAAQDDVIRERLSAYVETFNKHDAEALAAFWTKDAVSIADETGDRTEGRDNLQKEFAEFFAENSEARLTGVATSIRWIRPDVVTLDGRTNLFLTDTDPVEATFSAILVKEGDEWLISSAHESDLPEPATPYDALQELEWLVGTWQDLTAAADVTTQVRWSPNQAFLIRSYSARFGQDAALEGTQIIGWDPLAKQIRSWTFNSDGSFGQGTISRNGEDWMLKMWEVLADGRVASATKVMTRVDQNTITVQTIGEIQDGDPLPASDPVTVVRVAIEEDTDATEPQPGEQTAEPTTNEEGEAK